MNRLTSDSSVMTKKRTGRSIMRRMMLPLTFLFFMLGIQTAEASHYRYGNIKWTRPNNTSRTVTFTVTQAWRLSAFPGSVVGSVINPGTPLNFGDATPTGAVNLTVTATNPSSDWLYGTATIVHTYAGTATSFTVSYSSGARIGSPLQNNANGSFASQTIVKLVNGSLGSPVSTMPPIVNMPTGAVAATATVPASDPDGTTLAYSLATPAQVGSGFVHPTGLSVNSSSGVVTFNTVGKTVGHYYSTAVTITDASGANTVVDFLIFIVNPSNPPVYDYAVTPANGFTYNLNPGQPLTFQVKALDTDPGSTVTLSVVGTTTGMSFSPVLPATANPITTTFSWTPTSAQLGIYILNFTAQDNVGTQTQTSVKINVSVNPFFVVPPTPAANSSQFMLSGTLHTDNIQATNPTPGVLTRINAATLPTGATVSPALPTAFALNPVTTLSWTPTPADFGSNTVSFTALDQDGRSASHTYELVVNTEPAFTSVPVLTADACAPYVYNVTASDANIPYGDVVDIVSHNPLPSWLTLTPSGNGTAVLTGTPGPADIGTYTIELVAEDAYHHANPNHIEQSFTIIVADNQAPAASCQNVTVSIGTNGTATVSAAQIDNGSSDNCGAVSIAITSGQTAFTCSDNGSTYPVTLTVTDGSGNSSSCVAQVTVADPNHNCCAAPVASCQNTTIYLDANGQASLSPAQVDGGSTAACGLQSMTVSATAFNCTNAGSNSVTLTVTDINGASSSCLATVMVEDTIRPTITCGATVSVNADNGSCSATNVALGTPATADNCGVALVSNNAPTSYPVGTTTVTWTVRDVNGNDATCTQDVIVTDDQNPTIVCGAAVSVNADNGSCSATNVALGTPATADNCGVASVSNDAPTSYPVGTTTVTWTVTDVNGNSATCTQDVVVTDDQNPTIACGSTVSVNADNGSCAATNVALGTPATADNCGVASVSNDAPTSFPVGTTTVTWTVTDVNGNSATCTQDVVVTDDQNPTIVCGSTVAVNADNGSCAATNVALGTPATADNCGVASVSNDAPTSFPVGTTTVTWTVADVNGNSATCTQDVVVTDDQNPTIVCGSTVSVNADNGSCAATNLALGTPATADNCGVASVSNDAPTSFPVGTTTVTWTVTDVNGNSATCTQDVVVTDDQNPTIACGSTVSVNADNSSCSATNVALGTPATADNCGVASVSNNAPTSYPVGTTTVTWTVTDVNGNSATCTQDVVVTDGQNPTITCGSTVSANADNGSCNATNVTLGTPATADNCGVTSVSNNAPTSYPVGTTTVTWTVTDVSGNSATCTQDVVVTDNQAPVIACPANITLASCTSTASWTVNATDNCGIATIVSTPASGSTFNFGTTVVNVVVTDINGNVSACSFTVTRTNALFAGISSLPVSPVVTCGFGPGANIVIGYGGGPTSLPLNSFVSGGTPAYTYSWFPATNLSNASSPNPVFTPNLTSGCSNYNYTLTVTDANGCVATQTVTVKVVNVVAQYNTNGSVKKVKMCHITSSVTNTEVDIEISVNAVPTHLGHGDCLGDCNDDCDPNARFGHVAHDDHYQGGKVDVIPNPNNGSFGLEIVPAIPNTEVTVMIFDLSGKMFFSRTYSDVTFIHDDIDLNQINGGVAPGMYLVKVVNDEYVFTKKVTVAK